MQIVLITWPGGENDPFTVFNRTLQRQLANQGRKVTLIRLDASFGASLEVALRGGIDFAISWQGLGSNFVPSGSSALFWDLFRVPLFCIHGDHPSQTPALNMADADYVVHLYTTASYCLYANAMIPRRRPATYIHPPMVVDQRSQGERSGDFLVFPKNLDDVLSTMEHWKTAHAPVIQEFLFSAAAAISDSMLADPVTDHHAIVDAMLDDEGGMTGIKAAFPDTHDLALRNGLHGMMTKFYRNLLAQHVIDQLCHVPVKVYGRGWERFAALGNPKHEFLAPHLATDSDFQYFSNYGILDIGPTFDSFHDRSQRAIANRSGFLMGSAWPPREEFPDAYDELFFNANPGNLLERVDRVIRDPDGHRERCRDFGREYRRRASPYEFLKKLELMRAALF